MTDYTAFKTPLNRAWRKTYDKHNLNIQLQMPEGVASLLDFFDDSFKHSRGQIATTFMGEHLTYEQIDAMSLGVASYLQSLGLEKGDKVAVMMPNTPQYLVSVIGIIRAGLVLVNVNPLYTPHELEHQLLDSEAKALFLLENFAHNFEKVKNKGQIRHVILTGVGDTMGMKGWFVNLAVRHIKKMVPAYHLKSVVRFSKILKTSTQRYQRPSMNLDDVVILQYTGGTTGVAKGAMLTHGNLIANVHQCMTYVASGFERPYQHGDYMVVALPLYHIFSFMVTLLGMRLGFALLMIPNARDFDDVTAQFEKYRPVFFPAVNTLFNALLRHKGFAALDHSRLKISLGGGMSVLPSTAEAWEKLTGNYIIEGYGLSETSPVVTFNPLGAFTGKIGVPFPSTDVVLRDDNGREVLTGFSGEICVKGPQVMKGYWKRPDETAAVMTEDGYFRTGDIGVMDENGYFKIVDRKKDMILVSGFNVYPNEVEEVLSANPKVLECGVIGTPDEQSGEAVTVYVVRKDDTLTAPELKLWSRDKLTGYKRPRHIYFVDELPKSNVGKILRKELRTLHESTENKA
ncbi:MAG: AMP-binding protein [Moraxella sp.]|nr:AMP-binding protein [Moraxella sp.]